MTCSRHYTPAAINALQEASANIEAERRRMYRAEMARELRNQLQQRMVVHKALPGRNFEYQVGIVTGLTIAVIVLDELSPPVVCDSSE